LIILPLSTDHARVPHPTFGTLSDPTRVKPEPTFGFRSVSKGLLTDFFSGAAGIYASTIRVVTVNSNREVAVL